MERQPESAEPAAEEPPSSPSGGPPGSGALPPPSPPDGEKPPRPPGVIDQIKATIASGRRLVEAHVGLAKAELAVIAADAKQVAIEGGIALALVIFAAILVPVGTTLFLGEWLFGSMGWGVLHGAELSIGVAVILVCVALRVPGGSLVRMFAVALIVGALVGVLFALDATNYAWKSLGDAVLPGVEPGVRPLVTAVVVTGVALGLIGLIVGARGATPGRRLGGAVRGLLGGALAGVALGAFTAISFSPQVGIAIGVAVGLALWPALSAVQLRDYDWEALKTRFTPTTAIETTQETLEWLQQIQERIRPAKRS